MTKLTNFKKGLLGTVAIAVLSTGTAFADGTAAEHKSTTHLRLIMK